MPNKPLTTLSGASGTRFTETQASLTEIADSLKLLHMQFVRLDSRVEALHGIVKSLAPSQSAAECRDIQSSTTLKTCNWPRPTQDLPGPSGPRTPQESEKSPERVPRGRAPKVPKERAPSEKSPNVRF